MAGDLRVSKCSGVGSDVARALHKLVMFCCLPCSQGSSGIPPRASRGGIPRLEVDRGVVVR